MNTPEVTHMVDYGGVAPVAATNPSHTGTAICGDGAFGDWKCGSQHPPTAAGLCGQAIGACGKPSCAAMYGATAAAIVAIAGSAGMAGGGIAMANCGAGRGCCPFAGVA